MACLPLGPASWPCQHSAPANGPQGRNPLQEPTSRQAVEGGGRELAFMRCRQAGEGRGGNWDQTPTCICLLQFIHSHTMNSPTMVLCSKTGTNMGKRGLTVQCHCLQP